MKSQQSLVSGLLVLSFLHKLKQLNCPQLKMHLKTLEIFYCLVLAPRPSIEIAINVGSYCIILSNSNHANKKIHFYTKQFKPKDCSKNVINAHKYQFGGMILLKVIKHLIHSVSMSNNATKYVKSIFIVSLKLHSI